VKLVHLFGFITKRPLTIITLIILYFILFLWKLRHIPEVRSLSDMIPKILTVVILTSVDSPTICHYLSLPPCQFHTPCSIGPSVTVIVLTDNISAPHVTFFNIKKCKKCHTKGLPSKAYCHTSFQKLNDGALISLPNRTHAHGPGFLIRVDKYGVRIVSEYL
jgi:hypothetical protein